MCNLEVCICKNICIEEILEAIKKGVKTVEDIQEYTGAGTVCKMCVSAENDPYGERTVHLTELLKNLLRG